MNKHSFLKRALVSYLLLGIVDVIHHIHAAEALNQPNAMHAAIIGMVLVPVAAMSSWFFNQTQKNLFLYIFLAIALLAITIPGIFHGGTSHLVKVLTYLIVDTPETNIHTLFPLDNLHLWFYEITGIIELFLALVCACYIHSFYKHKGMENLAK